MSEEPQPTGEPCLCCRTELRSLGQTDLRTGGSRGAWKLIFGEWAELGEGTMKVEVLSRVRSAGESSSGFRSRADRSAELAPHRARGL